MFHLDAAFTKGLARLSSFAEGALAQVAPAAGGGGGGGGGAPAPAAPASTGGGGGGGGSSGMTQLLFPLLIFVAFYFFLIRPQQKKAKELASNLKKGDRVFTNAGLIGKIMELGEKKATLEIAPGVKVQVLRSSIGGLDEGDDKKPLDDAKVAEAKK
jgi:preprotein translocase subunit YajC